MTVCLCGEEKSGSCKAAGTLEKMASSSSSWCPACTFLLGKCTQECVFAPYFTPEDPFKFLMVHKVFGASNVAKWLHDLPAQDRKDAVISLAYEANTVISVLQPQPPQGCLQLQKLLPQNHAVRHSLQMLLQQNLAALHAVRHSLQMLLQQNQQQALHAVRHPLQMLLPQNQALHNQHIAAIANYEHQEMNSMFSMGGGAGHSEMTALQRGAAAAWASLVRQQILQHQQKLYLQQQQGQVSPAAAGTTSVHHHHLSLQQQQEGQERAPTTNTAPGRLVEQSGRF